nr:hypothetical protein [uncultured Dyadobacter sp.]
MKTLFLVVASIISFQIAVAQQAQLSNVPSKTTTRLPVAEGPKVWGVFHGRVPCQAIAKVLHLQVEANCEKVKWGFTFFIDPATKQPATYLWEGSFYREKARTGKWAIVRGISGNPDATVIVLDPDQPEKSLMFLKGDENVLFVLDNSRKLMMGDDYVSYTFNRVVN